MEDDMSIMALTGKGGVGKTSLAAVMVKILVEKYPDKKILAIDADPAVGLATALGVQVPMTIDDIRKQVIAGVEEGDTRSVAELLGEAKYMIFDAMAQKNGFTFLAVGRPEGAGCYCKINTYLKEVIRMVSDSFDYVVIDGEAGIEQVNRRVMEKVTHLVLVSDSSKKGTQVIQTINQVAKELVMYEKVGAVINRIADESVKDYIDTGDIPVLSYIPSDANLAAYDLMGRDVFGLPADSPIVQGAGRVLEALGVI
jgi:CO dehydrogenase maturation factor